jgi:cyclopropane fatty-acyl-phospholipid synthase-like methyltransferase
MLLNQNTLYQNRGSQSVLHYIHNSDRFILDVGCTAGDTGRLIKSTYPDTQVVGITCSQKGYKIAKLVLNQCIYGNVEVDPFSELEQESFDVICFCHVLEPVAVVRKFLPYLKSGGNSDYCPP